MAHSGEDENGFQGRSISNAGQLTSRISYIVLLIVACLALFNFNPFPLDSQIYAILPSSSTDPISRISGWIKNLLWLPMVLVLFRCLLVSPSKIVQESGWLVLLIVLCFFSALNAPSPDSIKIFFDMLFWILLAWMAVVISKSPEQLSGYLYLTLSVSIFVSVFGILLFPERAIHHVGANVVLDRNLEGLWKGGFFHKNFAGGMLSLTIIAAFFNFVQCRSKTSVTIAIVSTVFLYFSGSLSATISIVLALALVWLSLAGARNFFFRSLFALGFVGLLVVFPFFAVAYLYPLYGITLDSRVFIWKLVMVYNEKTPWLGRGFSGVFGKSSDIGRLDDSWITAVMGHAHSGIMDTYSQVGLIGVGILSFGILKSVILYLNLLSNRNSLNFNAYVVLYAMLVTSLIRSMVEPDFISSRANWALLVLFMIAPSHYETIAPSMKNLARRSSDVDIDKFDDPNQQLAN